MESTPGSTQQQYNLKWTNHTNNILKVFSEQLTKESFVDCTLTCEGEFIKVHKMILSGCSLYFQKLFEVHDAPNPLIIMNGIRFVNLKQIIDFMYHGEVKIIENELQSLLALAESFQVKGLSNVRANYLTEKVSETVSNGDNNNRKRRMSTDTENAFISAENIKTEPEQTDITEQVTEITSEPDFATVESTMPQLFERKMDSKRPRILRRSDLSKASFVVEAEAPILKPVADPSKIPRPPNAFMIFANEWRKKIALEYPVENNKEISVRLGNMWKQLPTPIKDKYYRASHKADSEHKAKYPGYVYSPKEARERKELKTNLKIKKPQLQQIPHATHFVKLILHDNTEAANTSDTTDVCI